MVAYAPAAAVVNPGQGSCGGSSMNPYEANLTNTVSRIAAWTRGLIHLYRRPLLLIAACGATVALAAGAGQPGALHATAHVEQR